MPKRCRELQINYLQCRMKSGLMEEEEMEKLGFLKENSWETEETEKEFLITRIEQIKK